MQQRHLPEIMAVSGIVMQKTIDDALSMTKLCGAEEKDDYI
jgi:hypothetical protein